MVIPLIGPMPAIGLGTWRLVGDECISTIREALELGYRHIDTADMYGNHREVGEGIRNFSREELFLVSKIIDAELRSENVQKACDRILNELQTPYLDLLLIHWPSKTIPIEETLESMEKLIYLQKTKYIGVSNFLIEHLKQSNLSRFPLLTNQIEMHPYLQEKALVKACQENGMIVTAYRPLGKGIVMDNVLLHEIGSAYNKTPAQVVLRWLYQQNIVSIPKAGSRKHLIENISIFDFQLSSEDMHLISTLEQGMRLVNK